MSEKAAIFVDLDSLNVAFKLGPKFVAMMNYDQGIDRLGQLLPAFGAGFDIYLCLKPRGPGEGDYVIDALSIPGLPFTVDSEELYQVLKFFRGYNGCGSVYLCNWVSNYIAQARVATFKSVVYYAQRVALIEVRDRILTNFRLFDSQMDFVNQCGDDFDGYGDLGLIDVDGLKAQYPEIAGGTKAQLTALAPLAQCYHTPLKLETTEFFEELTALVKNGVMPAGAPEPDPLPGPDPEDEGLRPSDEMPGYDEDDRPRRRARTPLLAKVFLGLSLVMAVFAGALIRMNLEPVEPLVQPTYFAEAESRINNLTRLTELYRGAEVTMPNIRTALNYCQSSALAVSIQEFSYDGSEYNVRCTYSTPELEQQFTDYLSAKYNVVGVNNMGQNETTDGVVYQYIWIFQEPTMVEPETPVGPTEG